MRSLAHLGVLLMVGCSPGATPSTPRGMTKVVGPEGGTVAIDGVVLEIPAGALSWRQVIHIYDTEAEAPAGFDGLSTVWALEPEGLVFARPARLRVPYAPDYRRGQLMFEVGHRQRGGARGARG